MKKEAPKGEKIQQQVISVAPVPFLPQLLNDAFHWVGEGSLVHPADYCVSSAAGQAAAQALL